VLIERQASMSDAAMLALPQPDDAAAKETFGKGHVGSNKLAQKPCRHRQKNGTD